MSTIVTPHELASLIQQGQTPDLIDVSTPAEFRELHLVGARNVPLDQLNPAAEMTARNGAAGPLYVICPSGTRSRMAAEKFSQAGFSDVINIQGGTQASVAAGLSVVRGKKAMSLERQVRIAAGSLVLLGFGLSFVHPWLIGLSVFVGAGLVFAGITNTCGMGMLLARMPWNQLKPCPTPQEAEPAAIACSLKRNA